MDSLPFGGWSVEKVLFDWIFDHVPEGKVILEFGSGPVSTELSKWWDTYSIEHNQNFMWKNKTKYIYAPMREGWYDRDILSGAIPATYDLILVDGPDSPNRINFYKYSDMFAPGVIYIFDDMQVYWIRDKAIEFADTILKRPYQIIDGMEKSFMVIPC